MWYIKHGIDMGIADCAADASVTLAPCYHNGRYYSANAEERQQRQQMMHIREAISQS
jgi:hypothetical protein